MAFAGAILVLGLAGALIGALLWRSSVHTQEKQTFEAAASEVGASVETLLRRDTDFVATLRTVLSMRPEMAASDFSKWYTRLESHRQQAGDRGTLVIRSVPAGEIGAFQARRNADPSFRALVADRVKPVPLDTRTLLYVPGARRAGYCLLSAGHLNSPLSTKVVERLQGNWCNPDSEVGGSPAGATSQAQFMQSITGSGRLLAQAQIVEGASNFFIEGAFYRPGASLQSVGQRRVAAVGWIQSSFDIPTLIRTGLGQRTGLSVALYHSNPGEDSELMGIHAGASATPFSYDETVALDGTWIVKVRGAAPGRGLSANLQGLLLFLAGVLLSALLAALVRVLGRSRERALGMVERKTGQLRHQALHDALTGLPNRVLALDRAEQMLARARREPIAVAALCVDLDGLKRVNDTFGHPAGDEILATVATRLSGAVREGDTAARLHGDEFLVLVEGSALDAGPELVAERLLDVLRQPYDTSWEADREILLTASIGVASGLRDSAEEMLGDADLALYEAKDAGRNRYMLFQSGMQSAAQDRLVLEMDLREALEQHQLFLLYQPLVDLRTESMIGVEALLRWRHPTRGVVAPLEFIPIAERSGLIVPIGRWILHEACERAARWHRRGHPLGVSVNVSARQLDADELIDDVRDALKESGLEPSSLTLEVTETALMRDAEASAARLRAVKQLGVRLAIDDFGTGYSSLAYLRQFPADVLKIDRSFINTIADDPQSRALIQTLVQLGKSLQIETLAEGIEEPAQLEMLQREQCEYGQGFLFSRPLDVDAVDALLAAPSLRAPATV